MPKLNSNQLNLTRRYLIWCYKTTKEELDKIDRYYTQLEVDKFFLKDLKHTKEYRRRKNEAFIGLVDDFEKYMGVKKENVDAKKFTDDKCKDMNAKYAYLLRRFEAVERAIVKFLGEEALESICQSYEDEMTRRILTVRGHN